ncbi:hypothetical protein EYM_00465 [Ignicoccus islandicus DSM 13165]|uniref:Uncharacterized protein n=1 Tax=Ignicoccus islandicus DSM 13165 TaxID=940295 RepID=A0A0U2VDI6_9CREN|nr:hypothetical protein [Ignicoccus islandicus]ALU12114.1 hypothetical protein EYM_00465 [Ignicoccus islandicus DSM 13165]
MVLNANFQDYIIVANPGDVVTPFQNLATTGILTPLQNLIQNTIATYTPEYIVPATIMYVIISMFILALFLYIVTRIISPVI